MHEVLHGVLHPLFPPPDGVMNLQKFTVQFTLIQTPRKIHKDDKYELLCLDFYYVVFTQSLSEDQENINLISSV